MAFGMTASSAPFWALRMIILAGSYKRRGKYRFSKKGTAGNVSLVLDQSLSLSRSPSVNKRYT